jgi:hypothetical protein
MIIILFIIAFVRETFSPAMTTVSVLSVPRGRGRPPAIKVAAMATAATAVAAAAVASDTMMAEAQGVSALSSSLHFVSDTSDRGQLLDNGAGVGVSRTLDIMHGANMLPRFCSYTAATTAATTAPGAVVFPETHPDDTRRTLRSSTAAYANAMTNLLTVVVFICELNLFLCIWC